MARVPADHGDKQDRILQAASRVFLEHGFSAATTDMIQREAGVSKATLYGCFANKEAMFSAVIQVNCAVMEGRLRALPGTGGDIAQALAGFGRAYLQFLLSAPGLALLRVVVADAPRFPQLARHFYLAGPKAVQAILMPQIARAAAAGQLRLDPLGLDAVASLFLDMLRGEGQLEALTHPQTLPSPAQIDRWVDRAVTTFLAAFGASR